MLTNYVNHYQFDDKFIRVEINPNSDIPTDTDFDAYLNQSLERVISESGSRVVVVDNLTYLRSGTESSKDALPLMKHLKSLKLKYGLSILCLAHTPKRDMSKPITRNDLQGSKMLINFCDSSFAIGESFSDKHLRYLKQIKQRNCENIYDADNVAVFEIAKPDNFLQFEFIGFGKEKEHLRVPNDSFDAELLSQVGQLRDKKMSIRDIAKEMQLSKSKVGRIVKVIDCPTVPLSHDNIERDKRPTHIGGTGQLQGGGKVVDLFSTETQEAPSGTSDKDDENFPF